MIDFKDTVAKVFLAVGLAFGVASSAQSQSTPPNLRATQDKMKEALERANGKAQEQGAKIDCSAAMGNAIKNGTTTSSPHGRFAVSASDIQKAAKEFINNPKEKWPDVSKWDLNSLRNLTTVVGQEYGDKMTRAAKSGQQPDPARRSQMKDAVRTIGTHMAQQVQEDVAQRRMPGAGECKPGS